MFTIFFKNLNKFLLKENTILFLSILQIPQMKFTFLIKWKTLKPHNSKDYFVILEIKAEPKLYSCLNNAKVKNRKSNINE